MGVGSESGTQREIPRGGGRVKSPLCLKDGLKERVKVVHVISNGVAAVGNGLIQLLIAYEAADVPAPGEKRQGGEWERTQGQVRMCRKVASQ